MERTSKITIIRIITGHECKRGMMRYGISIREGIRK
jgi:hypothetical protein